MTDKLDVIFKAVNVRHVSGERVSASKLASALTVALVANGYEFDTTQGRETMSDPRPENKF